LIRHFATFWLGVRLSYTEKQKEVSFENESEVVRFKGNRVDIRAPFYVCLQGSRRQLCKATDDSELKRSDGLAQFLWQDPEGSTLVLWGLLALSGRNTYSTLVGSTLGIF